MPAFDIAIGICTLDRPDGLARLLQAFQRLRLGAIADASVVVLVVDNSADANVRALVETHARTSRFSVRHIHEPRRGLASARNALLRAASRASALLASIDDDEIPSPDWLAALVEAIESGPHAAAVGPVIPLFEARPAPWAAAGVFAARPRLVDGFAREAYTGNCILRLASIERLSLAFDPALDAVGGEDTVFFAGLLAAGEKIAFAPEARAYECVGASRMRRRWLLRRWYRTGMTEAILRGNSGIASRIANAGRGLVRVSGALAKGLGRPSATATRTSAIGFTLCRGLGMMSAAIGVSYHEYDARRYRRGSAAADGDEPARTSGNGTGPPVRS